MILVRILQRDPWSPRCSEYLTKFAMVAKMQIGMSTRKTYSDTLSDFSTSFNEFQITNQNVATMSRNWGTVNLFGQLW